jgi:hypothetical protein
MVKARVVNNHSDELLQKYYWEPMCVALQRAPRGMVETGE